MLRSIFLAFLAFFWTVATEASTTPLATGNGFGFATYSNKSGTLTKFFAHPYKFVKADPADDLGEGIETANFIKSVSWVHPGFNPSESTAEYLEQSHVINVKNKDTRQVFFMPFSLNRNVLIAAMESKSKGSAPLLKVEWEPALKQSREEEVKGIKLRILQFSGVKERLVLLPLTQDLTLGQSQSRESSPAVSVKNDTEFAGSDVWALCSLEEGDDVLDLVAELLKWKASQTLPQIVEREVREMESWRSRTLPKFTSPDEKKLWRQSEVVLRMAQSREPNKSDRHNNGMIIASIPDGAWFVSWVRDMVYAVDALIKSGHKDESRKALDAFLNARPVGKMQKETGGLPYQISVVRYYGDGAEQPFFTMEGATNIEFDDWGLFLWVMGEYVDKFHDYDWLSSKTYRGTVYENAKEYVVKPLLSNLEKYEDGLIVAADTSIWEERQKDKKHFAYSTAAAIVGLENFQKIALLQNDRVLHDDLQNKIVLLRKGFSSAYVKNGLLRGALEEGIKNEVDGAMLSAINWKIVSDLAVMQKAVSNMERLRMPSGGYRRVTSIITDPGIFEYWYERQEFLFVNFSLAEVLLRLGENKRAAEILESMVKRSAKDNYIIPEMYVSEKNFRFTGEIGDPTGAVPMVGYGAGVLMSYLLQRQELMQSTKE